MKQFDKVLMGNRIKNLRKSMNVSQEELAQVVGMKRTNMSNYESGRVVPPSNILFDLAEFFTVSADYLLGRDTTDSSSALAIKNESLQSALLKIESIIQKEIHQEK